jgi:hypothetical protein
MSNFDADSVEASMGSWGSVVIADGDCELRPEAPEADFGAVNVLSVFSS